MSDELEFAFALIVSGLSIGLMYSLIALGFVLVYKATDAINFAQGEFVMMAGLIAAAGLRAGGLPPGAGVVGPPSGLIGVGVSLGGGGLRAPPWRAGGGG